MTDTEARDALARAMPDDFSSFWDELGRDEDGGTMVEFSVDRLADAILAALDGWTLVPVDTVAARQERERLRPFVMALAAFLPVGYGMPDSPAYEAWVAAYDALLAEEP